MSELRVDRIKHINAGASTPFLQLDSTGNVDFSSGRLTVDTLRTNAIQNTDGTARDVVLQRIIKRSTATASLDTTTFTEPNSDYRVSITPKRSNSIILLRFHLFTNNAMASNTLFQLRTRKYTGGSGAAISSQSTGLGSRLTADFGARPGNGYDSNDQLYCDWFCYDIPNSTATQTYGFDYRRETGGSGTIYFGYTSGDNSNWGIHSPILIIAEEMAT